MRSLRPTEDGEYLGTKRGLGSHPTPIPMVVLGIETSCDETAAAVVAAAGSGPKILSNLIQAQFAEHAPYGGVVPEIAARAHLDHLDRLVARALAEAGVTLAEIDGVAAAAGPGLIGGLIVGTMMAKGLAWAAGKPFLAVNHLEGHALTVRLTDEIDFPYLLLLVSGGHCQLLVCAGVGRYVRLGTTLDDAAGDEGQAGLRLLVLRIEDRGASDRQRPWPTRRQREGGSRGFDRTCDLRRAGGSDEKRYCLVPPALPGRKDPRRGRGRRSKWPVAPTPRRT